MAAYELTRKQFESLPLVKNLVMPPNRVITLMRAMNIDSYARVWCIGRSSPAMAAAISTRTSKSVLCNDTLKNTSMKQKRAFEIAFGFTINDHEPATVPATPLTPAHQAQNEPHLVDTSMLPRDVPRDVPQRPRSATSDSADSDSTWVLPPTEPSPGLLGTKRRCE